jgi:hypothetical protein
MGDQVAVRVRDCACPDAPHDGGDEVYLRPRLGLEGGLAADAALLSLLTDHSSGEVERLVPPTIGPIYVRYGVVGWNLADEDGPMALDVDALLDDYEMSRPIWEKADELYSQAVLRPLLAATRRYSPNGQMDGSTSPSRASRRKRPRQSGRSSRASSAATGR